MPWAACSKQRRTSSSVLRVTSGLIPQHRRCLLGRDAVGRVDASGDGPWNYRKVRENSEDVCRQLFKLDFLVGDLMDFVNNI